MTARNGNPSPPDAYLKEIRVPLHNQAIRAGMVLTAESAGPTGWLDALNSFLERAFLKADVDTGC